MIEDVIAIIPARSGSKSIKNKNILKLNNKPLLAWSIELCLKSKLIEDCCVIVKSDLNKGAKIYILVGISNFKDHILKTNGRSGIWGRSGPPGRVPGDAGD